MGSPKSVLLPVSDPPRGGGGGDDALLFKGSAMTTRGAYAALSYMSCAVLLVMFNKAALSSYSFPCANVITLFQMVCSTCILYAMKRWKIISFTVGELWTVSDSGSFVPLGTLLHTLPLSIAYLLYMLASMESVRGVNVPMYTTLRRTTVVFTMIVEYLLIRQKYTHHVVGSVALIVLGAFVAGARDLSFDAYGYAIVLIANLTTAVYLATIARIGKSSGLNSFGLMWCNGVVCGPILLFWTYFHGDLELTMNFPHLYSAGFQVVMLLSCILAFFLNYSIFLNTTLNSALTQTMCGNLKDLFTVGLGWVIFGGLPFDLLNVIGQGLGFVGSGFYAYCKLKGK
ncbi:UDP-N-acetylglucosamine transporter UGNT1-like [Typha latifolia]|uniref:UDP-N-acetylglucosamine transporter UGNT1-like n=1 Tax=Typha latifolia TaxID=4733 RepID=UPI003C2F5327